MVDSATSPGHRTHAGRAAVALLLAFQGLYLLLASGRPRTVDEHAVHFMAESLWREAHLATPQMVTAGVFYGRVGRDGRPYAPYGPGQALLAVPYYAIVGGVLERAGGPPRALLAREAATSLVSTTAAAACVACLFLLALRAGAREHAAVAVSAILGTATVFAVYAKQAFMEPLLASLGTAALLALARGLETGRRGAFATASVLAGYAFLTKFTAGTLLMMALLAGYLVERRRGARVPELAVLLVPFALAATGYLALNHARFGDPFQFGYPTTAEQGKDVLTFRTPLPVGLYGLLLSPGKGLLLFAPAVVPALTGFQYLWHARPGLAAAVLTHVLGTLLFYGGYSHWEGGYCFGPRYLVPILPGLLLPLALALDRGGRLARAVMVPLLVAGLAVTGLGVSTSFLEDQAGRGAYYDLRFTYRLDYTLAGQLHLLERYGAELIKGRPFPERLGLGLDFWWVFLGKAGFPDAALNAWAGASALLVATGALMAARAGPSPSARGSAGSP